MSRVIRSVAYSGRLRPMITGSFMVRNRTTDRIGTPDTWRIAPDSAACLSSLSVKSSGSLNHLLPVGSPRLSFRCTGNCGGSLVFAVARRYHARYHSSWRRIDDAGRYCGEARIPGPFARCVLIISFVALALGGEAFDCLLGLSGWRAQVVGISAKTVFLAV